MREIKRIVVHASGHSPDANPELGALDLHEVHRMLGDPALPYHAVVRRDGTVERGLEDDVVGRAMPGFDADSLHVCLIGGLSSTETFRGARKPAPEYEDVQLTSLKRMIDRWRSSHPGAVVVSASGLDRRRKMPGFDAAKWYRSGRISS
jgi:hypothetical protein